MDLVILLHEERVSKHTPTGQIPSQVQAEVVDRGVYLWAPIQPKRFMAVLPREIPVVDHPSYCHSTRIQLEWLQQVFSDSQHDRAVYYGACGPVLRLS